MPSRQLPHDVAHERLRVSKEHQGSIEVVEWIVDAREARNLAVSPAQGEIPHCAGNDTALLRARFTKQARKGGSYS